MSLTTMLQVELDRDTTTPKKRVPKKAQKPEASEEEQRRTDLLIHAIPTEVLAPYTALVGGIVATIDAGEDDQAFLRWTIYVVGIAAIILFQRLVRSTEGERFEETVPLGRHHGSGGCVCSLGVGDAGISTVARGDR